MDISTMSRYESPISPTLFPHLSIGLLSLGLFFSAWLFVYEVGSSERNYANTKSKTVNLKNFYTGHLHEAHTGTDQGAGARLGGLRLHGIRNLVSDAVDWNIRLEDRRQGRATRISV